VRAVARSLGAAGLACCNIDAGARESENDENPSAHKNVDAYNKKGGRSRPLGIAQCEQSASRYSWQYAREFSVTA
jgi:hypothetical protein